MNNTAAATTFGPYADFGIPCGILVRSGGGVEGLSPRFGAGGGIAVDGRGGAPHTGQALASELTCFPHS